MPKFYRVLAFLLLIPFLMGNTLRQPVSAPSTSVTADDLLQLVNGLRTGNGLPALTVNSILMSTAQSTAETMAAGNLSWHIGSTSDRIKAAGYGGGVTVWATENFATGTAEMTIEEIQAVWADEWHMIPMKNPIYCDVGAGVATSAEGNTYYVVHAAYTDKRYCGQYIGPFGITIPTIQAQTQEAGGEVSENVVPTDEYISQWMAPVVTVTPNANGELEHTVLYGHTLWSIAITYGTKMDLIKKLNNMWYDDVYAGQKLLIPTPEYWALTPTITLTPTPIPHNPVTAATQSRATPSRSPSPTLADVAAPGEAPTDPSGGVSIDTLIFLVVGIGFVSVVLSFWRPWKSKPDQQKPEDPLHTRVE